MRNHHNQLFFPCLESPLRLYLSVATTESASAAATTKSHEETDSVAANNTNTIHAETNPEQAAEYSLLTGVDKVSPETLAETEDDSGLKQKQQQQSPTKHHYLSLNSLNKKKVCLSDTPHEWCLLWTRNGATTTTTATAVGADEDDEDDNHGGIRASAFVLQSVDRKVFLTCNGEGTLSTCTKEYLETKQQEQYELEQEQELILQDTDGLVKPKAKNGTKNNSNNYDDQGSFTWQLDYEDESGMVISLINSTYQRKLAVLNHNDRNNDGDNKTKPICTTLPVVPKTLNHDDNNDDDDDDMKDDAHLFPGENTTLSSPPPPPPPGPLSTSQWRMRFRSGELLFLSNPTIQRRLRCDAFGKLTLDENWKGWEVFRFVEAGHGGQVQIVSWTHDSYLLYSNQYGKVGLTQNVESPNTLWTITRYQNVEDGTAGGILLQSVRHGRFLSALSETELATVEEQNFAFAAVQWELEPANRGTFFLNTTTSPAPTAAAAAVAASRPSSNVATNHHFLSSRSNGKVFSTKRGKDWEEWELKPASPAGEEKLDGDCKPPASGAETPNVFSIFSTKHQKYLGSSEDGNVYTSETLGESEYWELEEAPHGAGYIIISHLYCDRQLYCSDSGNLETSPTECQAWNLQPKMPSSISKNQIAAAGVAAATLLVASPLTIALGACARAPLAAMMVGGAEVVTAEAAVAYGVGTAVLGTSAVAIMADHKNRLDTKKSQQNEHPIQSVNRPFVGWRSW